MIDGTRTHYRITAALGAGGMGEVYLAEDTKLDRKVASKILTSATLGRLARFGAPAPRASRTRRNRYGPADRVAA